MSPSRPLTVLHLVANRWWTGSAEPVIRLLTGLRARGHRVLLGLIAGDRFEQKAREAGLEPLPGLSLEVRGNPIHALADLRRVRAIVRAEGVDVIHTHHSHDHWLGWLARGGGPAALVRTFHNARAVRLDWPSIAALPAHRRADRGEPRDRGARPARRHSRRPPRASGRRGGPRPLRDRRRRCRHPQGVRPGRRAGAGLRGPARAATRPRAADPRLPAAARGTPGRPAPPGRQGRGARAASRPSSASSASRARCSSPAIATWICPASSRRSTPSR